MDKLLITFVSNYFNHHQRAFCDAMSAIPEVEFTFIQMEDMEAERVRMGWAPDTSAFPYVLKYKGNEEYCRKLMLDSDMTIFGGVDETLAYERQDMGKATLRYSERIYKEGQWKFISPRGLIKKNRDHTRYKGMPVYLLCAGGYVASDYSLIKAYPEKKYVWGYFPEVKEYSMAELHSQREDDGTIRLLWCGRMIDWKHPEAALDVCSYLDKRGIKCMLDFVGGGELEERMREEAMKKGVPGLTHFNGFKTPEETREYMRRADIFLFTSDQKEGWGAVLNEAMNSGCAVVASHAIGAVPYMLRHNENGFVYRSGNNNEAGEYAYKLAKDRQLRQKFGYAAYDTVSKYWNAEYAAERLYGFIRRVLYGEEWEIEERTGLPHPMQKAPEIRPGEGYGFVRGK